MLAGTRSKNAKSYYKAFAKPNNAWHGRGLFDAFCNDCTRDELPSVRSFNSNVVSFLHSSHALNNTISILSYTTFVIFAFFSSKWFGYKMTTQRDLGDKLTYTIGLSGGSRW